MNGKAEGETGKVEPEPMATSEKVIAAMIQSSLWSEGRAWSDRPEAVALPALVDSAVKTLSACFPPRVAISENEGKVNYEVRDTVIRHLPHRGGPDQINRWLTQ